MVTTTAAGENRRRLIHLLEHGHQDDPDLFRAVPADVAPVLAPGWLWRPGTDVHPAARFGLRDARAYTHLLPDGRDPRSLFRSPDTALGDGDSAESREYVRRSVDLTMKGGTTSGVVYPVAVCEIARRAVLRNVGGSSAGAIAAAAAAAAEIGRSGLAAHPELAHRPDPDFAEGRVRAGFAGLADVTAWLAEADRPDGEELHRLGQLFRPPAATRAVFRVLAAVMRRQFSRVPLLLVGALGPIGRTLTVLVLLVAPVIVTWAGPGWQGPVGYLMAAAWLAVLALVLIGGAVLILLLLLGWRSQPQNQVPDALHEPLRKPPPAQQPPILLAAIAFAAGLAGSALLGWLTDAVGVRVQVWPLVATWLVTTLAVVFIQVGSIARLVLSARSLRFGLLAGSDPGAGQPAGFQRHWLWDRVAGAPAPTVRPNLIDWLTDALNDLAGLNDQEVLRFGHLWQGADFGTRPDLGLLRQAAQVPRARQVNLELMTSELVHGVPLRFPLRISDLRNDQDQPVLFVRRSDLEGPAGQVLPPRVIDAICADTPQTALDVTTGEPLDDLYPLPMPWDLPVVFAVRMSMSLPVLFQAVRLYRGIAGRDVRDSFGLRLARHGRPLHYPAGPGPWVEELWLADGGITSNFPIHFFDAVLPRWPTLGINLGTHPRGSAHQDVWLPGDAEDVATPSRTIRHDLLSFLSGVLNTGLNWRDTVQTVMPAFRGRVATVRTAPGEGGNNLFMGREQVAGLALRGATAGVRLARRYHSDAHWRRHEYLRARVGLGNLASLTEGVARALSNSDYREMVADGPGFLERVRAELADVCDPNPPYATGQPDGEQATPWFDPPGELWPSALDMLDGIASRQTAGLQELLPQPAPELKQVPNQ